MSSTMIFITIYSRIVIIGFNEFISLNLQCIYVGKIFLGTLVYAHKHTANKLCHNPLCVGDPRGSKGFYVDVSSLTAFPTRYVSNSRGEAKICYYVDSDCHTEMIHTDDAHKIKGPHIFHLSIPL